MTARIEWWKIITTLMMFGGMAINVSATKRGWFQPGNGFQYSLTGTRLTYKRAQAECEGWNGKLAMNGIRDQIYFKKLASHFKDMAVWVGLDDITREGHFVWNDGMPAHFAWLDAWHIAQPDNRNNQDCVVIVNKPCKHSPRHLDDVDCRNLFFGICEVSIGNPPTYRTVQRAGIEYALLTSAMTYELGQTKCQEWGGELATNPITDASLASFVITLYPHGTNKKAWVGMNDKRSEGTLDLVTGGTVGSSSVNWYSAGNTELADCAAIAPDQAGKVSLLRCDRHRPSLCQKLHVPAVDSMPSPCLANLTVCGQNIYRTMDGSCNNRLNIDRGRSRRAYKRMLPASYEDGVGSPRGGARLPTPRAVTQAIRNDINEQSSVASHQFPLWGQLLAHDLSKLGEDKDASGKLRLDCPCGDSNPLCFNIKIPDNDIMKPEKDCIPFVRAKGVLDINCKNNTRQQENTITAYIDASNIYGSKEQFKSSLVSGQNDGKLLVGTYNASCPFHSGLPLLTQMHSQLSSQFECDAAIHKPKDKPCFAAGDIRANEQTPLMADHTTWLRMHNKIAQQLTNMNSHWDGTKIFETARSIVSAMHQQITFNEFLPIMLGDDVMRRFDLKLTNKGYYYGYDPLYDATADVSVMTAALRLGHTLVNHILTRPNPDFSINQNDPIINLHTQFFNAIPLFEKFGAGSVIRGMVTDHAMKFDTDFAEGLIDRLFAEEGKYGKDLPAINIQRGRDHGVPSYNEHRKFCGLKAATNFDELVDIPSAMRERLRTLYNGVVDDIDLFVGGISENSIAGGIAGPTFACLLGHQFRDVRKGDAHWFENGGRFSTFTPSQLEAIKSVTLSSVICDVADNFTTIQPAAMKLHTLAGNQRIPCSSIKSLELGSWNETSAGDFPSHVENVNTGDYVWTMWFPITHYDTTKLPLNPGTSVLRSLRVYRPDDVCNDVMGTDMRSVNGYMQIRFKCPPGQISGTDFPFVDSAEAYWTTWSDQTSPQSPDFVDDEGLPGSSACAKPVAVQAQTLDGIPARESGDVFEMLSPQDGLLCRGKHQPGLQCKDYRVRYLCNKG
ncbi:myeloperoxidase [Ciona intestinalis]